MYVDNNLIVSGSISAAGVVAGQTVTGAGTVVSTNTIDLLQAKDIGAGAFLRMRVLTVTAAAGGTSVEFQAITSAAAALTSPTVIGSSGAIAVASLTAGSRWDVELNTRLTSTGQRYLGGQFVTVGTTTAGAYLIDFGDGLEDAKYYASGFAVS